ncbi:transposase [Flavobacterium dauae]|uniref:ISAon1 family transposase n=1 Tax=Flavobacterium dauae TaxID=1563479 RepID=UPI001A911777|nr:transposase [Flavobacterium dauae]WLD25135.1 transposase [Flavobacterium dauae]WLD25138.1 transposase [Flavobacterium dauae]WLD25144.1 transposase [Flavobacterium dauae]WLD25167.1 transposase [Flavobacterium dauae]WLD25186.1 transposase [Flavobacterium dauae]
MGGFFGVNGKKLQRQYKKHLSSFSTWQPKEHAHQWIVYPQNIGTHLAIDEVALSQGELYTIVTNKKAKGKKGSLVAIIAGTKTEQVIEHISKIDLKKRQAVIEITLDMANSMKLIAKKCFPKAVQVTDRFHVQKLTLEALQELRIKHRWEAMDKENQAVLQAKSENKTYNPPILNNGDTVKQLLVRSRYLLYKSREKWTKNQEERAEILFKLYPDIKTAYSLSAQLRTIYNSKNDKNSAMLKLAHWYRKVEEAGFKNFNIVLNTIKGNYQSILNYFDNRSTNASAEAFNAKIKAFRSQFRGVRKIDFFLFRLSKLFA